MITEKSMSEIEAANYDMIIVGGGITGALVAKVTAELALKNNKRLSILILEAGQHSAFSHAGYDAHVDTFYNALFKTPNSPYPDSVAAPSPNTAGYFVHETGNSNPLHFGSENNRALGGTTLHWMGISLRMMPNDFSMFTCYGQGVDWPFSYEVLKPFYEKAEWEIGIAADTDIQLQIPGLNADYFGKSYQFPMEQLPMSHLDQYLADTLGDDFTFELEGQQFDIKVVPIPQARNANPHQGDIEDPRDYMLQRRQFSPYRPVGSAADSQTGRGQRCEGNGSCIPICPARAKYTALKSLAELTKLAEFSNINVDILSRSVASRLICNPATSKITEVEIKRYHNDNLPVINTHRLKARNFILAASAIENARLLLNSPMGDGKTIANSSSQVGKNLMDHPFIFSWGKSAQDKPVHPFRGPLVTSDIPVRDGDFRKVHSAFRTDVGNWGWSLCENAPESNLNHILSIVQETVSDSNPQQNPHPPRNTLAYYGKNLQESLKRELNHQFFFGYLLEQMPVQNNCVTVSQDITDAIGIPKPIIKWTIDKYTLDGMEKALELTDSIFQKIGGENLTNHNNTFGQELSISWDDKPVKFIGAGHIMGTHRMGSCSKESVVNEHQQSWDHKNLYVVGCGSMPTTGTSNPTLTAAALSIKTAEFLYTQISEELVSR